MPESFRRDRESGREHAASEELRAADNEIGQLINELATAEKDGDDNKWREVAKNIDAAMQTARGALARYRDFIEDNR